MPRPPLGNESRTNRTYRLEPQAHAWAAASGNANGYVNDLLIEREAQVEEALWAVQRRGISASGINAVADATNGVMWSEDIPHADQVRAAIESAHAAAWGVGLAEYAALTTVTEAEARALRLLVWEAMHGRTFKEEG